MAKLDMCVVGAGSMGQHHARILASMPSVNLVGIVDSSIERGRSIASRYGVGHFQEVKELLSKHKVNAAVIAVPTVLHLPVARELIEIGISVLIEKPIAIDLAAADQIIAAAERHSVTLSVGHIERFNAAVLDLKERLINGELGKIFHIETRRQGPFPSHVKDIGVVMDLAVHDLDLIRFISNQEIVDVMGVTARRLHESHEDFVRGTMHLSKGAVATVMIDWLTPTKIREITVTGERGMFQVDLLTQDLFFFENSAATLDSWDSLDVLRGINEGRMIRYPVKRKEPLLSELEDFVSAVVGGRAPLVAGKDGRYALKLANALIEASDQKRSVTLVSPGLDGGRG